MVASDGRFDEEDVRHMRRALLLAERGRGRTSPNPMVGALIVADDGAVVGRGFHEVAGGPHAEVHALADAGERARGATLYCTLEPCSHTGRTGPCAPRVAEAGIRRAVVAIEDPNPLVRGRGFSYLRERGIDVTVGTLAIDAARLNRPFFTRVLKGRPFVTMKAATSLDGRVAARVGERTMLTGAAASLAVQRERAEIDAIAIGSETVVVDDPLLTVRETYRYRPLVRVVFDRRLRTPPSARLLTTLASGPVVVMGAEPETEHDRARAKALGDAGAQVELFERSIAADATKFLESALQRLAASGVMSMVVEGGPRLHESFWQAGLVDRVELFLAPRAVGDGGVPWIDTGDGIFAGLAELAARPLGEDVLIEGYVQRAD